MKNDNSIESRRKLIELWKKESIIKNELVVNAFLKIVREDFLPEGYKELAYSQEDIRLDDQSIIIDSYKTIRLLVEASLSTKLKVLQIGSITGYEEALLSTIGVELDVIEPRIEHIQRASANLGTLNIIAPQYYRRLKDISKTYDRIICFNTISSTDKRLMELVNIGIMVLSVGEKHLLIRMVMEGNNNPIMQFKGSLWLPLIDDYIFS
ncbi:MAG: hypothetical protein ACMXYL_01600 [Candidatus Woesearchaeota archaeon]